MKCPCESFTPTAMNMQQHTIKRSLPLLRCGRNDGAAQLFKIPRCATNDGAAQLFGIPRCARNDRRTLAKKGGEEWRRLVRDSSLRSEQATAAATLPPTLAKMQGSFRMERSGMRNPEQPPFFTTLSFRPKRSVGRNPEQLTIKRIMGNMIGREAKEETYSFNMKIITSTTLSINDGVIFPALRRIMFLSAVKIRRGRMKELTGSEPKMKSVAVNASAEKSFEFCDVIWQSKMSSPGKSAITKAGRLLVPDKSENGKGMTIISPFTNFSMPNLLQVLSSLLPKRFHLRNEFLFYRFSLYFQKPYRPICEPTLTSIAHYSLIYCVLLMFPLHY